MHVENSTPGKLDEGLELTVTLTKNSSILEEDLAISSSTVGKLCEKSINLSHKNGILIIREREGQRCVNITYIWVLKQIVSLFLSKKHAYLEKSHIKRVLSTHVES